MADILSKEEIEALDQAKEKRPVEKLGGKEVHPYDFKHPARVNRRQLRMLEGLHDNFARLLGSTLTASSRQVVHADTAFVDQTTCAEFVKSLSNPSCSYEFTFEPAGGRAVLDFALPVVFGMLDRIYGGRGSSQGVEGRQLTPVEIGEFNNVVKKVIEDLEATWEPLLRAEIRDIELETNPEFLGLAPGSEIVLLLAFEVRAARMSGLVSLCYPFFTLEPVLPLLWRGEYWTERRGSDEEWRRQNRLRLGAMPLELSAELGRLQLTLGQVRSLRPGDVLCTSSPQDEPLPLFVGGEPRYLGYACAGADGRQKVRVAGEIAPQQQARYRDREKKRTG